MSSHFQPAKPRRLRKTRSARSGGELALQAQSQDGGGAMFGNEAGKVSRLASSEAFFCCAVRLYPVSVKKTLQSLSKTSLSFAEVTAVLCGEG